MNFKDSNIDWISQIPTDWTIRKLKYILNERIEKNNPIKTQEVLSLTAVQGVVPYSEKKASGGNKRKDDLSNYKIAYPNDIVVNSMNIVTGSVGISKYYGCVSPVYYMFYNNDEKININYYNYIFKSKIFQKRLIGFGNGILQMTSEAGNLYAVRMKIPIDKFKSLLLPVPPIDIQNDIVNYLDNKTKFIDKNINRYKKLADLLEEKRVTLIKHVITKGLNPNVPMKDSGIEWMGQIPQYWEINKIKKYFYIYNGSTPKDNEDNWDGDICWITPADYKTSDIYINNSGRQITKTGLNSCGTTLVPKGSIIISNRAPIGTVAIANVDLCTNQGCKSLVVKEDINTKFVYYVLSINEKELNKLGRGTTFMELSSYDLGVFKIPIAPDLEQKEIVNYLDKETLKINQTINKIKENISLLEEYKTSLIHNVVTGKVDVRGENI